MYNNSRSPESDLAFLLIKVRKHLNEISEQLEGLDPIGKQELYKEVLECKGVNDIEFYNDYIRLERNLNVVLDLVKQHSHGISLELLKANSSLSSYQLIGTIPLLLNTVELVEYEIEDSLVLMTLDSYKKYFQGQKFTIVEPWEMPFSNFFDYPWKIIVKLFLDC